MLSDAKEKNETAISEAFENAVSSKLQDIQLKLEKTLEEKRKASEVFFCFYFILENGLIRNSNL